MVQQYGQPPQYGGVPPAPQYGAPPQQLMTASQIGMPPAEIKWSGLETGGGFHLPVTAFIGRLTDIVLDAQSQFGLRVVEKYDQVQILQSPVPWPWATIEPSIKYSAKENSAWGKHIASAKALGLAVNAATLDQAKADLIGKMFEVNQIDEAYGEDKATGQTMHGDVWKFVRIIQPGQAQPFPQPQYAVPQPVPVTAPLAPVAQVAQPITGIGTSPSPSDTAPVRAKKLLHGRALNEWLGVALTDDLIKADSSLINSVYDQSFIVGLKGSGQVVQGADGKFRVVA